MAKAQITMPDGMIVKVEGTPKDITEVVQDLEKAQRKSAKSSPRKPPATSGPVQLPDLIASLHDGGFFKSPKDLGAIKLALEEMGRHYPVTTLSPAMLRAVRKRKLRRIKKDNRWFYTL
jgi:hypothetical protein